MSVLLAKEMRSRLTILYTYRLFKANGEGAAMKRKMEEQAAAGFLALEQEVLKDAGVPYEFRTEVGFMKDRIEQISKKTQLGFLVMGKEMNKTNRENFDELIKDIQVPLVIVP